MVGIDDVTGEKLMQRKDDAPETAVRRLALFHKDTVPVLDHYSKTGKVVTVDGDRSLVNVACDIGRVVCHACCALHSHTPHTTYSSAPRTRKLQQLQLCVTDNEGG